MLTLYFYVDIIINVDRVYEVNTNNLKGDDYLTADELINYISDNEDLCPQDIIEITNDIVETLIKTPKDKVIKDLMYELENYADTFNKCPKCGQDLEIIHKDYEPSEYQGQQVNEGINTWGCNECGWIKE